jgi:SagB-type dehydrogenase family enzyme
MTEIPTLTPTRDPMNLPSRSLDADQEAVPVDLERPAEIYHESSKLMPSDYTTGLRVATVNASHELAAVIAHPTTRMRGRPVVDLPNERPASARSFEAIVEARRSTRAFAGTPLSLATLGKLLHLGAGVTALDQSHDVTWHLRAAPSAGGLYAVELYCCVFAVDGVTPGVYSYEPVGHRLEQVVPGDTQAAILEACYLEAANGAAVCFVLAALMPRIRFKYGERAYRFVLLEAGHIAQNLLLGAEAEDLGAVAIGGFVDDRVNHLIGLDGCDEIALYAVLAGARA